MRACPLPHEDALYRRNLDLHRQMLGQATLVLHEMQKSLAAPGNCFRRFRGVSQGDCTWIVGRQLFGHAAD